MKLKVSDIVQCCEGINKFLDLEMSSDIACRLRVMSDKIKDEYVKYSKAKDELITKYGAKDKNGIMGISPTMERWKEFVDDLEKISEVEVDINVYTIKLTTLLPVKAKGNITVGFYKLIIDDVNTDLVEA